jgi:excisionase family DNA binding protein
MSRRTTADSSNEACGTLYASRMLGVSVATVQTLVERGELSATRTKGGHRRIAMSSVRDYLARHGVKSGNQYFNSSFLKVLVVDDDMVALELIRHAFEEWGLPVDCTVMSSAMEAVMDIGSIRPDLLISDLRMPGIDGFEFLRSVRKNPAFSQLMILVVTGMSEEEIALKGGLPAHTQVIHKPLNLLWLQGYVTGLIGHKAMITGIPAA